MRVFTRPSDLTDADVVDALFAGWGIDAVEVSYAPVGFGSHHWWCSGTASIGSDASDTSMGSGTAERQRWFVTVDDLLTKRHDDSEHVEDARRRLNGALHAARTLHEDGLEFIVAPLPTNAGDVLVSIGERFAVALYPFVEGETHEWGPYATRQERLAVIDRLAAIHSVDTTAGLAVDDFVIPQRAALVEAMETPEQQWGPGPFAAAAHDLLNAHASAVREVLDHYDRLVARVSSNLERYVVTHGEPHRGNTITTAAGVQLIDWDTALVAPPERDLWAMVAEDPGVADCYTERAGIELNREALRLFELRWDLCEVSLFTNDFRQPHIDSEDTRTGWGGLRRHLDPSRWAVER